jgi:hypothetical protein
MNSVATKCEVVEIEIDTQTWEVQMTVKGSDPNAEAVSFCADQDCTLLFTNHDVFKTDSVALVAGMPMDLHLNPKRTNPTTDVKVLVVCPATTRLRAPGIQVCGGPRIIVP